MNAASTLSLRIALLVLLCTGSGNAQTQNPPPAAATASNNYRIAASDVLNIRVFQEDELETTSRVAKDGTIPLPLIGNMNIGGRTTQDAAQAIQDRLREYLVRPQVTVRVTEYSKRRFTVLGQVAKPGTYDLPDDTGLNLLEAIGMAGGYTRIANTSKITLKRQDRRGGEEIFKLDGKRMAREKDSPRFEVLPGDTIVVAEGLL